MAKSNIQAEFRLQWDQYIGKSIADALPSIYEKAKESSRRHSGWYWESIATKRRTSLTVRAFTFVFLVLGTLLPLSAAVVKDTDLRLLMTQFGVAALAFAGLLQLADRVFGWSSGWIRYITTATAMENLIRSFELDWAAYLLGKSGQLADADVKPLFDLAAELEKALARLQDEETSAWKAEFNSGAQLLGEMIKSQRESGDKAAQAASEATAASQAVRAAAEAARKPGAIEVTLVHKGGVARPVTITLDHGAAVSFNGPVWSKAGLAPGIHELSVATTDAPPVVVSKAVGVKAAETTTVECRFE